MNIIKRISTEEMVGEFLKAELHSSRFREGSLKALSMLGYDQSLLNKPDYTNATQNRQRTEVLGLCRGWPNKELFDSFPPSTEWFFGNLSQAELAKTYRLKSSSSSTEHERLLSVTAHTLKDGETVRNIEPALIKQIVEKLEHYQQMPPIILVAASPAGKRVLIEGHSRSTAYVVVDNKYLASGIPMILGISPDMPKWAHY